MKKEILHLQVYDYKFFFPIRIKEQFETVFKSKSYFDYEFIKLTVARNCIEFVFQSKKPKGKKNVVR